MPHSFEDSIETENASFLIRKSMSGSKMKIIETYKPNQVKKGARFGAFFMLFLHHKHSAIQPLHHKHSAIQSLHHKHSAIQPLHHKHSAIQPLNHKHSAIQPLHHKHSAVQTSTSQTFSYTNLYIKNIQLYNLYITNIQIDAKTHSQQKYQKKKRMAFFQDGFNTILIVFLPINYD